jgi:hypothetical protein
MSAIILDQTLTAAFTPSKPILIAGEKVVLDFRLVIPGPGPLSVQWYPEFTEGNPFDPTNLEWFREVAEEDIGNGNVRMSLVIRRFTINGADTALPAGTHRIDCEFKRTHKFFRIQMLGLGCVARVIVPFGEIPSAP